MPKSTLDPDNMPTRGGANGPKGHDTRTLGPSDSSDSGSDMAGPGALDDDQLGLDRGTNEDPEGGIRNTTDAGPSVGDAGMDSDSDRYGTGERSSAGKEPRVRDSADVDADRLASRHDVGLGEGLDQAEEGRLGVTDEELTEHAGAAREPFEIEDQKELLSPGQERKKRKSRPR